MPETLLNAINAPGMVCVEKVLKVMCDSVATRDGKPVILLTSGQFVAKKLMRAYRALTIPSCSHGEFKRIIVILTQFSQRIGRN